MAIVAKQLESLQDTTYVDSENIKQIREVNGVVEYTLDGKVWLPLGGGGSIYSAVSTYRRKKREKRINANLREMSIKVNTGPTGVQVTNISVDISR